MMKISRGKVMGTVINGRFFTSKEKAKRYYSAFIDKLPFGEIHSIHHGTFFGLLSCHPFVLEKIGCGIKHFEKRKHPVFKNWTLHVIRTDGSEIDFSYRKCIEQRNPTHRKQLTSAMRFAVGYQISDFANLHKDDLCGICNEPIPDEKHVDHVYLFKDMVDEFLEEVQYGIPGEFTSCPDTFVMKFKPEDILFELEWKSFHLEFAKLRMTHKQCNLNRAKCGGIS